MASNTPLWSHRLTLVALICYIGTTAASGAIKYCSSLNTGTDFTAVYYQWQSYGECHDTCSVDNNYALSIIQGNNCWCSDYAPGVTTDTDDCNEACPGYPDDICGGSNLFVYYQMNKVPIGTKGGSSTAVSTPSSQITVTKEPDPPQTETVFITPQPATHQDSSSSTSSSSTKQPTTTPPTTQPPTSTSSPWTPTPKISVETVGESVRTVTITPTSQPAAASAGVAPDTKEKSGGGGLGTGGAVGLAIGLIALFAMIGGAVFWFYKRKKRQNMEEEQARRNMDDSKRSSTSALRTDMTRSMSQHSRFVLGSNGQTVVGGFEPVTPTVEGSGSSRISAHGLKPVDPRLDPFGVAYGNRSRESLNTINDGHDYTRKILRTTNPDPDHDD